MYHHLLMQRTLLNVVIVYRGQLGDKPDQIDLMDREPIAMLRLRPSARGFYCEVETIRVGLALDDEMDSLSNVVESYEMGDAPDRDVWSFEVDI